MCRSHVSLQQQASGGQQFSLKAHSRQAEEKKEPGPGWLMPGKAHSPAQWQTAMAGSLSPFTAWNLLLVLSPQEVSHWEREDDATQTISSCDPFTFTLVSLPSLLWCQTKQCRLDFLTQNTHFLAHFAVRGTFKIIFIKADLVVSVITCFIWVKVMSSTYELLSGKRKKKNKKTNSLQTLMGTPVRTLVRCTYQPRAERAGKTAALEKWQLSFPLGTVAVQKNTAPDKGIHH